MKPRACGRYNPRLSGAPIHKRRLIAVLLAFGLATFAAVPARAAAGVPETRTLPNGLRIVLLEDHALPIVAVSLWVGSGSKDEVESSAGYAHFLEHLIQRGTENSGPFEYTRKAQRWGGALSVRANYDRTAITLSGVPSSLDDLIQAAASMAFKATLKDTEIDLELGTLSQEIRTYYDLPSSVSLFEGMRAAFPGHPYRFPSLGHFRSVGTLKAEPLTAFYKNLYVPNNMAIAVAGDFEPRAAAARVEAAFGPASKSATLPARPNPPWIFPGHSDVEKKLDFGESWTALLFTGPGYRHPDRPAFEALSAALADPSLSPLPLATTRDQNGTLSQASFYGLEDAGLLYIAVNPSTPQLSYNAAASALRAVVAFRATGFTDASARDLVARLVRDERQRSASLTERAERLGEAALFGGARYYWDRPDVLGRLNAAELNRVAAKYLVPENCRLMVLVPKDTPALSDESKAAFHQVFDTLKGPANPGPAGLDATLYPPSESSKVDALAWGKGGGSMLGTPRRTVLKNGVTLVVLEDHRMPLAAVSVNLKGGSGTDDPGKEGRAGLLLRILGTRTAQALRDRPAGPEKRPALLPEAQTGRDLLELRFAGDASDVPAGLEAIAKSLRDGVAGADLDRVRQAALQNLARADQRADVVGLDLFHEKVYAGHPYAQRPDGTTSGVQAVTSADLQAIAPTLLDPSACVVAVAGDVDAADIGKTVERLFGPWKGTGGKHPPEAKQAPAAPAAAAPKPAAGAAAPEGTPGGAAAGEVTPAPEAPVFPATAGAQPGEYTRQLASPQSLAGVGVPAVPLRSADFDLVRTLGAAVTLFGFEDMVFERRAAFGVSGSPEGYRDGGALVFEATAQHARRDEAVFELQRLMRRLAVEDLGDTDRRDLARIQAGRAAAAAQGTQALASLLAYREASGLDALAWRRDLTAGDPPAAAALRSLAERLFQTERNIRVVIGPPSP
ncbi:MAG TPA: insulinase family protein [Candidatus Polarisedimenticolia bacterium]|nr:insulinase family protein [Candidatus Polarisedimenticolia bacterium]